MRGSVPPGASSKGGFPWLSSNVDPRPHHPLRAAWVLLLAALLALTVAASSLIAGARLITSMLPNDTSTNLSVAPAYGAARNGLVAYETLDGDVNVYDPGTGTFRTLLGGADNDFNPIWSPDGTRLAFVRFSGSDGMVLMVANADGSGIQQLTADPFAPDSTGPFLWSPDGRHIAFDWLVNGVRTLRLARTDGSGVQTLDTGMPSELAAWKPPLGDQILFRGTTADAIGLYSVPVSGGAPSLVLASKVTPSDPAASSELQSAGYSPDGSRIAFVSGKTPDASDKVPDPVRVHVVNSDGSADRVLHVLDADWETHPSWSPDGSRLLVMAKTSNDYHTKVAITSADGGDAQVALETAISGNVHATWSPDGKTLLMWTEADGVVGFVDVASHVSSSMSMRERTSGMPDWQRLAP